MTDKNGVGVTVIGHDSEKRTLVNGCDPHGCYSRDVHYLNASLLQLSSLAAQAIVNNLSNMSVLIPACFFGAGGCHTMVSR